MISLKKLDAVREDPVIKIKRLKSAKMRRASQCSGAVF